MGKLRMQHSATRQEWDAVFWLRHIVAREQRSFEDAAVVAVRDLPKFGSPYRQLLQEYSRLHRARQVRPAVEAPALLLQPAARDHLLLHGPTRPPSMNALYRCATVGSSSST